MKITLLAVSLLLVTNALAVRLEVKERMTFEPVASARKAGVLRDARAAFTLSDGSQWITHSVPADNEPGAIGVTRFGTDGSERVFLLSDWLPEKSIPRGWAGQVYGVALLDDGRIAVSGGWTDGRNSHNAILVLRARKDGGYDTERVNEVPGVSQIAGAQRNTILAVTSDASMKDGGPLMTLYDTEGRIRARMFAQKGRFSAAEAARNAAKVHLHRISEKTFAFYDPTSDEVGVFDLEVTADEAIFSGRTVLFVGDDTSTAGLPVVGIDTWADGDILVARAGNIRGRMGTELTIYGSDHSVKQVTFLDRPWNLMLREKDRVHGVVRKGDVALDTVVLRFEN